MHHKSHRTPTLPNITIQGNSIDKYEYFKYVFVISNREYCNSEVLYTEPVRSVYLAVDGRRLDAGNTWVPVRDKTELEVHCVAEGYFKHLVLIHFIL